jgi:hypothetical protein
MTKKQERIAKEFLYVLRQNERKLHKEETQMLQMIYNAATQFQTCGCNTNELWELKLAKQFAKKLPYNFERFIRFLNKALMISILRQSRR